METRWMLTTVDGGRSWANRWQTHSGPRSWETCSSRRTGERNSQCGCSVGEVSQGQSDARGCSTSYDRVTPILVPRMYWFVGNALTLYIVFLHSWVVLVFAQC